jgi:hypothetical protein
MSLYEFLRRNREQFPAWLERFEAGAVFPRERFFESRVVYYPGSGTDGQAVRLFGSTHSAHCFVYADYGVDRRTIVEELEHPQHGFLGYHSLARVELNEQDLSPRGWIPHIEPAEVTGRLYQFAKAAPFGFLEVLERNHELDDGHGARRLAILFLGADGMATYDALFCQDDSVSAPFAVVLQDHGFGGNYDRFGGGGLLERLAARRNVIPRWLLVGDNTAPWEGFDRAPGVDGDRGGMHAQLRFLYGRVEEQ